MLNTRDSGTMKWFGIGTLVTVSAVGLAACGDGGNTTQTGTLCTALPPLAVKSTYKIGFAQVYEENGPWRDANTKSIMDEAAKRGYELVYERGTKPDAAEQVARMQALIAAKVDAIIIAPHDEIVLAPSVVAARRACIPVFIEDRAVDTNVAIPGVDYVSYIGSDFRKEGELTADWLIAKTGGQARSSSSRVRWARRPACSASKASTRASPPSPACRSSPPRAATSTRRWATV